MTQGQINFLIKIGVDPKSDLDIIEDMVGDYLTFQCLNENYEPDEEGLICESILDYIGRT